MTTHFKINVLIWLLTVMTCSAQTGQNYNNTDKMTGNYTEGQMTTQKASSPSDQVSGENFTRSITADANPTTEAQTTSTMSQSNSSMASKSTKELQTKGRTTLITSHTSNPTTATMIPLSSSTQSQNPARTSTFQQTSDKMTKLSTHGAQSTTIIFTTAASTEPNDNFTTSPSLSQSPKSSPQSTSSQSPQLSSSQSPQLSSSQSPQLSSSQSPRPSPSQSPRPSRVTGDPAAMKTTSFSHPTEATKGQNLRGPSNGKMNHGKIAAGLIGGALMVMMLGFLVIFIKKRKIQKQQITTTDWAGPSPFLEGTATNGMATRRSSNRISLASFLPQRLSRRLSLLPETDEELQEMTAGTTFGNKQQGITFCQEVDNNVVKESIGTSVGFLEIKSTEDAAENAENSVAGTTSQTDDTLPTSENSDTADPSVDSANSPAVIEEVKNALVPTNDDLK